MNEESKGLQASATKVRIDGQVTATPPAVGEFAVQERAQLLARIVELEAQIKGCTFCGSDEHMTAVCPMRAGGVDERAAKGSRKALGAVNAKLKAKVGRLEREIAGLKIQRGVTDYREAFEAWGRREGVALWPNPNKPEIYYCGAAQKAAEAFKAGAEWQSSLSNTCRLPSADDMADRFISWPLPDSVRPDPCAMNPDYPYRYGTNLLTWAQAKAMFDYVLAAAPSAGSQGGDV